jgi:hypothetical protein
MRATEMQHGVGTLMWFIHVPSIIMRSEVMRTIERSPRSCEDLTRPYGHTTLLDATVHNYHTVEKASRSFDHGGSSK